jgi:hypothetical protein
MSDVIDRIAQSCNDLGEVDLSGIRLENADPKLLDVSQMELDKHVSMQPSAVAYYGSLFKDATRRLEIFKRNYNKWSKKKMAEAKVSLMSGTTAVSTIRPADIEARFIVDNEEEIEKWDKQQDKLQFEYDTLSVWYDAWKQKSFSMNVFVNVTEDERFTNSSMRKKNDENNTNYNRKEGLNRIKSIIRDRQEKTE